MSRVYRSQRWLISVDFYSAEGREENLPGWERDFFYHLRDEFTKTVFAHFGREYGYPDYWEDDWTFRTNFTNNKIQYHASFTWERESEKDIEIELILSVSQIKNWLLLILIKTLKANY